MSELTQVKCGNVWHPVVPCRQGGLMVGLPWITSPRILKSHIQNGIAHPWYVGSTSADSNVQGYKEMSKHFLVYSCMSLCACV